MFTKVVRACAAFVAVFFFAMTTPQIASSTTLVDQGNNTTLDNNTGLLWLDVNLTLNIAKSNVIANYLNAGQLYEGWRYATGAEVGQMFNNAGMTNGYIGPFNGQQQAWWDLIQLLGPTGASPPVFATSTVTLPTCSTPRHPGARLRPIRIAVLIPHN